MIKNKILEKINYENLSRKIFLLFLIKFRKRFETKKIILTKEFLIIIKKFRFL